MTTDQRGLPRGLNPDRGAFERQSSLIQVSGRVSVRTGRPAAYSIITLRDTVTSQTHTALANPFGYYRFLNLEEGKTYVISINSKRWLFAAQTVTVIDQISNLDFVSEP